MHSRDYIQGAGVLSRHSIFPSGRRFIFAIAGGLMALTVAGAANASVMTGSMGAVVDPFVTSTATYTSSSVTLFAQNLITTAESGTFATEVPSHGDLTADATTITGLSTSPLSDSISDFFVFSTPDATLLTSGTSPSNNRFDFNLATITEPTYLGVGAGASFSGTGTLVDTANIYSSTPAEFTLSFPDGNGTYSFTIATVPEPTSLASLCIGSLVLIRRRAVCKAR
ncbi:MAG: PEP-CTERM sorting domain-containing protein [Tepidisphaeraceae bacterium]|jgi:hypothetical protein